MSAFSNRTRNMEATARLTGSPQFQMPNRHRHCKVDDGEKHEHISVVENEAQQS